MKKTIYTISFVLPVAWLIYCMTIIENRVKNHLGYGEYAIIPIVIAIIMVIALLIIKYFKGVSNKAFYVPLSFAIVGLIIFIVGGSIACCVGG